MTQTEFDRFYLGSKVRCEWDHSIAGTITGLDQYDLVIVTAGCQDYHIPLNQLEFVN